MSTPINGETFLPQLIADYLESQRSALGFPDELNLAAWPYLAPFARPCITIECGQFRPDNHPATMLYDMAITLDYGVEGEPSRPETAAQRLTRLQAQLTEENAILSKMRAALALRTGQTITFTSSVESLFDWITNTRTVPSGEEHWGLEDFIITSGGGQILIQPESRTRTRVTTYVARMMTNEFTV